MKRKFFALFGSLFVASLLITSCHPSDNPTSMTSTTSNQTTTSTTTTNIGTTSTTTATTSTTTSTTTNTTTSTTTTTSVETYYESVILDSVGGKVTQDKSKALVGEVITYTAIPDEGYSVKGIKVNDEIKNVDSNNQVKVSMPEGGLTTEGLFEVIPPTLYDVNIIESVGGTLTASPMKAEVGEEITFTLKADEGYEVTGLIINDESVTLTANNTYTTTMVEGGLKAQGQFSELPPIPQVYKVTIKDTTGGTVTASPMEGLIGDKIQFRLQANEGYEIKGLIINNVTKEFTTTVYETTMVEGGLTVQGVFTAKAAEKYTSTIIPSEGGSVSVDKESAIAGETITYTLTANIGYKAKAIIINEKEYQLEENTATYTTTMAEGGNKVQGVFEKLEDRFTKIYFVDKQWWHQEAAETYIYVWNSKDDTLNNVWPGDKMSHDIWDPFYQDGAGRNLRYFEFNTTLYDSFKFVRIKNTFDKETTDFNESEYYLGAETDDLSFNSTTSLYELSDTPKWKNSTDEILQGYAEVTASSYDDGVWSPMRKSYASTISEVTGGSVTASENETKYGQPVTYTATPDENYKVLGIKINDKEYPVDENNQVTVNMPLNGNKVEGMFEKQQDKIVRIYFADKSWWHQGGAGTFVYAWDSNDETDTINNDWPGEIMSHDIWDPFYQDGAGRNLRYFDLNTTLYDSFKFIRMNSAFDKETQDWHDTSIGYWGAQTSDIKFDETTTLYELSDDQKWYNYDEGQSEDYAEVTAKAYVDTDWQPMRESYTSTITEVTGGSVTASADEVKYGQPVTYTATPDEGYYAASIMINEEEYKLDNNNQVKINMPIGGVEVKGVFKEGEKPIETATIYFITQQWWNKDVANTFVYQFKESEKLDTPEWVSTTWVNDFTDGTKLWKFEFYLNNDTFTFSRRNGTGDQDWGAQTVDIKYEEGYNCYILTTTEMWTGNGQYATVTKGSWVFDTDEKTGHFVGA